MLGSRLVGTLALLAVLVLTSVSARAADLVVWWEKGYYTEEDKAVRELVTEFEQTRGKKVELAFHLQSEMAKTAWTAIEAGSPPGFLFGVGVLDQIEQWAFEGRLVDLTDAVQPLRHLFDADVLDHATLLDGQSGRRSLYALPMGRSTNHLHVWKSLLEQAGFKLEDIPKEWAPFWSFWCDQVQPAVRKALGRDDIWAVGLPMSPIVPSDLRFELMEFVHALGADYVTPDGRLVLDEPRVRAGLVAAVAGYTAIWRKGCTPPDSLTWDGAGNNKAFLAQRVVITANQTLSIPNALRTTRPDDYYENLATIEWPRAIDGSPLTLEGDIIRAVVFAQGRNPALGKELVRFLVADGWLAHWATGTGDRFLPPMRKLIEQPFWLDLSDMHRLRSAVQTLSQPHAYLYSVVSGNWRHRQVNDEAVWEKAVHRVATGAATPEQAVGEAIARIKRILGEPE